MKLAILTIILTSFSCQLASAIDIPHGFEALIENPPSISANHTKSHKFEKPSVILQSKDFIALITISEEKMGKAKYQFRTYSKIHKLEVSGEGELYENYYSISDPNSEKNERRVIDKGSKLVIDAGIFKVEWSAGSYIYFGEGVTAEVGDEVDFRIKIKER